MNRLNPEQLKCPACGDSNLHHDRVEVFERKEDESQGLHVTVSNGQVTVDRSLSGNPSDRRHGIRIHFWCEGCGQRSAMALAQHKGVTQYEFDPTGEPYIPPKTEQ